MQTRSLTPLRTGLLLLAFALVAPAAFGQMPQPQNNVQTLSSSEVSDKQLEKVARIAVAAQMSTRKMQMQKRRQMQKKYGNNPQQMDSTKKAQAKREMMKHRRKVQKKRMQVMQQEAKKEGIETKMVRRVLMSTRQDSTLQQRFRQAVKAEMKKRRPQMGPGSQGGGGQGGGSQ